MPTYEGRDSLLVLLEALSRQTLPPERFEVVVVVDGSQDGTREELVSFSTPYALLTEWQENRGRAAAINTGLELASAGLIVLVDDDLEPAPDFLAAHVATHESGRRMGAVGAVHFHIDDSMPPFARFWGLRFEHFLTCLPRGSGLRWNETYTGAFSIARAEILGIGGFDPAFDGYGLEDFEFALRLTRAGVELEYHPEAVAYHGYDKTFRQAAREAESRGRSAVIFSRLHAGIDPLQFGPLDPHPPSLRRRCFRYVLPRMSGVLPFVPGLVAGSVGRAERRRSRHLELAYTLGLEYFFFLGVRDARRDGGTSARGKRW